MPLQSREIGSVAAFLRDAAPEHLLSVFARHYGPAIAVDFEAPPLRAQPCHLARRRFEAGERADFIGGEEQARFHGLCGAAQLRRGFLRVGQGDRGREVG